jgi:hypothetical protein
MHPGGLFRLHVVGCACAKLQLKAGNIFKAMSNWETKSTVFLQKSDLTFNPNPKVSLHPNRTLILITPFAAETVSQPGHVKSLPRLTLDLCR